MVRIRHLPHLLAILISATAAPAQPLPDDCRGATWDLTREAAIFTGAAMPVAAALSQESTPTLELEHVYELQLQPISAVTYQAPPASLTRHASTRGGLIRLAVVRAGRYRVSVSGPVWIDVEGPSGSIEAAAFQGHLNCTIHKSVEFEFPTGSLLLQLGGNIRSVRILVSSIQVGDPH